MDVSRRRALKTGGGMTLMGALFAAGLLRTGTAAAEWNQAAFSTKSIADTLKVLGGTGAAESADIVITAPSIAENGAVVPIAVQSKLAKTESIAILIEKNPNMLAASFDIPSGTEADVGTRVKMGQTSDVHVVVKADGKFYRAVKEVKVTLGGCGG
jgi:sulfur-oxidizing protein SoxY